MDRPIPGDRIAAFFVPTPTGIELRHLRTFVVAAERLHFGKAAADLHLSQPALSRQIATLERLLGCTLLHRSTQHVEVTPAGAVLLDRARAAIGDIDRAVALTRSTSEDLPARIARWVRPFMTLAASNVGLDELRAAYETMLARSPMPPDVLVRPVRTGGVPGLVVGPSGRTPTALHLHGGGFVMGSAYGYRSLAGAIGVTLSSDVLVPDYRLAPEHPFPGALEDALSSYRWMVEKNGPDVTALIGDSAGAGLVMNLLLKAREEHLEMPRCVVLLSPWIDPNPDLSCAPSREAEWIRSFASRYVDLGDVAGIDNPLEADLHDLPPVLVQVGSGDPAVDQGHLLARAVRRAGGSLDLQISDVDAHVFHYLWSFLPEAGAALDRIGTFVADHTAAHRGRRRGSVSEAG